MSAYLDLIEQTRQTLGAQQEWSAVNAEYVVRVQLQNRFKTGLEDGVPFLRNSFFP